MKKDEIREEAAELGLSAADAKDSQDICFIPDGDYVSYIEKATGESFPTGDFIDADGKVIWTKDHTTIMHGVNKIEEQLKTNPDLVSQIDIIKKKINPI